MGTLIILEGGDGSGKATQTKCLVERFQIMIVMHRCRLRCIYRANLARM